MMNTVQMAFKFNIFKCCVDSFSTCFLQADRLRRMMGEDSAQAQIHISADDLNDGFILNKNDKKTVTYQVRKNRVCGRVCVNLYYILLMF